VEYIKKDITTVGRGVIAHGVNCQHVMGSGVALAIKTKYPIIYDWYMIAPRGEEMLGTAQVIEVGEVADNLFVSNCYTQLCYGRNGKFANVEAVEHSLRETLVACDWYNLDLFLPKIGAGRGGLNWEEDVLPVLKKLDVEFSKINIFVCVHEDIVE